MAKTNPIGVRFDLNTLTSLREEHKIETYQKALDFLEKFYLQYRDVQKGNLGISAIIKGGKDEPVNNTKILVPATPKIDNTEIQKQIEAIKAQKMPSHITTTIGKKAWNFDQLKKIKELKQNEF